MNKYILILVLLLFSKLYASEPIHLDVVFTNTNPPFSHSSESEEIIGLIPELVSLLLQISDIDYEFKNYPWARAQKLVETSVIDAFCTYPSTSRGLYANFTTEPLLHLEYNYLIFNKDNVNIQKLINVEKLSDLDNLTFVSQTSTEWEEENIPTSVKRLYVYKNVNLLHSIFGRNKGDFIIMNLEEATYLSKPFGYSDKLLYKQVTFIPDSIIPFHFGISKKNPQSNEIIEKLNITLKSEDFIIKRNEILKKYK